MHKIYLAGAISDAPDSGIPWREDAKKMFSDGYVANDPLDKYNATEDNVNVVEFPDRANNVTDAELVMEDKVAIEDSDAVLVNWQSNLSKTGTPMEVIFAYERGIPVVVWHSDRVRHELSPWIRHHTTFMFERFEDAVEKVEDVC